MRRIHPHSVGIAFGAFLGLWHTFWAFLVFAGVAQWLIDFIFRLHMIAPPYKITGFNLPTAIGLILVTTFIGYVSGLFIGIIWNRCATKSEGA
jgi:hypothetical protein